MQTIHKRSESCKICGCTLRDDCGKVCHSCDAEYYVYCRVCKKYYCEDASCSHVIHIEDGYLGCGSTDFDDEYYRQSFFALLDRIGRNRAEKLRAMLNKHEYSVHNEFKKYCVGPTLPAVCWILSLEAGVTKKADRKTAGWITTWLRINKQTSKNL